MAEVIRVITDADGNMVTETFNSVYSDQVQSKELPEAQRSFSESPIQSEQMEGIVYLGDMQVRRQDAIDLGMLNEYEAFLNPKPQAQAAPTPAPQTQQEPQLQASSEAPEQAQDSKQSDESSAEDFSKYEPLEGHSLAYSNQVQGELGDMTEALGETGYDNLVYAAAADMSASSDGTIEIPSEYQDALRNAGYTTDSLQSTVDHVANSVDHYLTSTYDITPEQHKAISDHVWSKSEHVAAVALEAFSGTTVELDRLVAEMGYKKVGS